MSLVTRCPHCETLFRVTPVQLQAHAGQVRCGRCTQVFDGFEALGAEQEPVNSVSGPIRFEPEAQKEPAPVDAPPQPGPVGLAANPGLVGASAPAKFSGARLRELLKKARTWRPAMLLPPSQNLKWTGGIAFLALVLVLQTTYVFRKELAGRSPGLRAALERVCDTLGCTVTLPQRPDLVRIEASDVHMIDANRTSLIQLTATLRSYAGYDVAYPALDLVLTNANEHALARRIFLPQDYLGANRDPRGGIPPNAELTVALDLDTTDLNAAGFRLDLLAAPAPGAREAK